MKEDLSQYKPIDCNLYDVLLEKATIKESVKIIYLNSDNIRSEVYDLIIDVYTEKGFEFLKTQGGSIIQLDRLISVGQMKFSQIK